MKNIDSSLCFSSMSVINGNVPEGQNLISTQKEGRYRKRPLLVCFNFFLLIVFPFFKKEALRLRVPATSFFLSTLGFKCAFGCPSLCLVKRKGGFVFKNPSNFFSLSDPWFHMQFWLPFPLLHHDSLNSFSLAVFPQAVFRPWPLHYNHDFTFMKHS